MQDFHAGSSSLSYGLLSLLTLLLPWRHAENEQNVSWTAEEIKDVVTFQREPLSTCREELPTAASANDGSELHSKTHSVDTLHRSYTSENLRPLSSPGIELHPSACCFGKRCRTGPYLGNCSDNG